MLQTARIRTEKPPVFRRRHRQGVSSKTTTPFPGFIPGASFDATAPSRREALQQFHRLEMMLEVEERLRAEDGLVHSDTGGGSDDGRSEWGDKTGDKSRLESAAKAALHDAREELAGRTLHADPYCVENVWSEAQRECQVEEGHRMDEDEAMFSARKGIDFEPINLLEADTHAAIMEDLEKLHSRIQQARAQKSRHSSPLGDDAEGASSTSESSIHLSEEVEFDPERYVAPLLRHSDVIDGAELWTPQFGIDGGGVICFRTAHDIFSDTTTVQEALQLLQYSVHSNRPDVVACVQRCQEHQRQHQPITTIPKLPTEETVNPPRRKRKVVIPATNVGKQHEEEAKLYRPLPSELPPSAEELAAILSKTLPAIPDELRNELIDQRRLLERLAAAQEASFRQLAREQQESARRRIMAPRADTTMPLLAPSKLQYSEPFEIAEALQNLQADPKRPLPPVITISTVRPQSTKILPPSPPLLPPHYLEEELRRLHRHYEKILRDERRAWTDIMQKQKATFEMEKNAAVQTLRSAAEQRQNENTEEIKRAIALQEIKRRRWQYASESKQRIEFQKMLYKTFPLGDVGHGHGGGKIGVAARTTPGIRQRQTDIAEGVKFFSSNKQIYSSEAEREEEDEKKKKKNENKRDLKRPFVRGPFSVVLPEEPGVEPTATAHDASLERVDEVVMLSDGEEKNGIQQARGEASVSSRALTDKLRIGFSSPAGKQRRVLGPQRSPYAVSSKPSLLRGTAKTSRGGGVKSAAAAAASGMKHARAPSHSRGARPQHRLLSKGSQEKSPHAFAVHDARIGDERNFYNTTETVLTESVHSLDATLTPPPVVGGTSHLHENTLDIGGSIAGQAVFPRSILLLSDPLTSEEMERQHSLNCAFNALLPPPPRATTKEGSGQIQRPCDIYYFGEEHGALTPRRRAKLRAAEAQTRIEARRRLEHIKALSLTSKGQKLGEPVPHSPESQLFEARSEQRLADLLANETIHSIIGGAAEESLFADLFKELEDELVSAELRRLAFKNLKQRDESGQEQKLKEEEYEGDTRPPDMVSMERAVATAKNFDAPINEEIFLEETVLRLLEESLLHFLLQEKSDEKEEEKTIDNENIDGGEATTVSSQRGQTVLMSDGAYETETGPLWVREIVSATTDPLWHGAEEEVNPPRESSIQATTMVSSEESAPVLSAPPLSAPPTTKKAPLTPASTAQMGVVITMEGARGNVVPDTAGTVRIVLDIAPVMEHLTAIAPLDAVQPTRPAQVDAILREDPRLPCAKEEELISCEVVDAPTITGTHRLTVSTEVKRDEMQEVRPPLLVSDIHLGESHLPVLTKEEKKNVPQPSPLPLQGYLTVTEVSKALQSQHIEIERQKECARLCDNELIQRQVLEEQEDTLRASWHMMWDWQQMNVAMLVQHQYQKTPFDVASQPVSAAVPFTETQTVNKVEPSGNNVLPPAPLDSTIRDPITRFIFEWMHDYDEKKKEETARKRLVELPHEASCVPEGKALQEGSGGTCTSGTEVRRRLLFDIDNAESSSWLSSTHLSSFAEDGFPRFANRPQQRVARPQRKYRRSGDENVSSETTETTRYTNSSSMLWLAQEAWSRGVSPPPVFPTATVGNATSTTVTTSSSSRTWPSTSSSEKPHLRETMLRHLRRIQSSDPYQQGEQESQREEYPSVEELRKEVERVQAAEQIAATHDASRLEGANQESRHTEKFVALLPLLQRPQSW
ncbi:hypothetical protein TcG_00881 [Trypanosoma cruzi]|nr:hypothetical protein TcG_00881 [Trypanosoma cruzi]